MGNVLCENSDGCIVPVRDCRHGEPHGKTSCLVHHRGCTFTECHPCCVEVAEPEAAAVMWICPGAEECPVRSKYRCKHGWAHHNNSFACQPVRCSYPAGWHHCIPYVAPAAPEPEPQMICDGVGRLVLCTESNCPHSTEHNKGAKCRRHFCDATILVQCIPVPVPQPPSVGELMREITGLDCHPPVHRVFLDFAPRSMDKFWAVAYFYSPGRMTSMLGDTPGEALRALLTHLRANYLPACGQPMPETEEGSGE